MTAFPSVQRLTMKSRPSFAPLCNVMLQRKCACGGTSGVMDECDEWRDTRLQQKVANSKFKIRNTSLRPPLILEGIGSLSRVDAETRGLEPRCGHDFGKLRVHADSQRDGSERVVNALAYPMPRDVGFGVGQLTPGTTRQSPTPNIQQPPDTEQTADTKPIPMQNGPGKGPAITVT